VQKLWLQLQVSLDPDRLIRFAESFPNTSEAYLARERAAELQKEIQAEAMLDKASLAAVSDFVNRWPNHHHAREISALIPTLQAEEDAQRSLASLQQQQQRLARPSFTREDQDFLNRAMWMMFWGTAGIITVVFIVILLPSM
jgi:hypothetical protein